MTWVMFNFRPQVPAEKREQVLRSIAGWDSVLSASLLHPHAEHEIVQVMAYANVEDAADLQKVARKIANLPEVESTSVPRRPLS